MDFTNWLRYNKLKEEIIQSNILKYHVNTEEFESDKAFHDGVL